MQDISSLAEELLASEEGLCSVQLVWLGLVHFTLF